MTSALPEPTGDHESNTVPAGVPQDAPELSVIILNYNAAPLVDACLRSLAAGCMGVRHEVIVVDNASRLGDVAAVVRGFPGVRLIQRRRNGGFAAGMNTGLRRAAAPYALILNPDTVVAAGAARRLLDYATAHPAVGILAPKLLNPDGSVQLSCRRFPTFATALFNRNSALTRLLPGNRYSRAYLMTDDDHTHTRSVDWVSGAAMLLNMAALHQTGPFDARYFFEIEDVDLARRMQRAGYEVVYFPDAVVTHLIGASSRTRPNRVILARHSGMWRYYRTYMAGNFVQDAAVGAAILLRCAALLVRENVRQARTSSTFKPGR